MKNDISYFILASNTPNDSRNIISYGLSFLCIVIVASVIILKYQEANANNNILKDSKGLISLIDKRIKLNKVALNKGGMQTNSDIEIISESSEDDNKK